jgi:hypothetical protein
MANIPLVYNVSLVDIQKFKDFGTFANNFDDFGNLKQVYSVTQSVSGSLNYVNLPLKTFVYNESKILDTNTSDFTELQTTATVDNRNINTVIEEYNKAIAENRILNETINELVTKYEESDDKQVIAAMKNEIINLRIELGQGNVPSDFGDDFPFLPLT